MKLPSWIRAPIEQVAYKKTNGHNLYDKIGNPLFLSQKILNVIKEPLEDHEYSIEIFPSRHLKKLHPGKIDGDILVLNIHGVGKYYLLLLRDHNNEPLKNKDGYFLYQMFETPHLNKPCYATYHWEEYKKYSDEYDAIGVECAYVKKTKQKQGVKYTLPEEVSIINLKTINTRILFSHRVPRPIKIPKNEPLIVNPLKPPIQVTSDPFDVWSYFNRILYTLFASVESSIKISSILFGMATTMPARILERTLYQINTRMHSALLLSQKDRKTQKTIFIKIACILLKIPLGFFYIFAKMLNLFGQAAQKFFNIFAAFFSIFAGYYRVGGFKERWDIFGGEIYNCFVVVISVITFVPQWIGDVLCDNLDLGEKLPSQTKTPNLFFGFLAKIYYIFSIITQVFIEMTSGICDIGMHHHEINTVDNFFTRTFLKMKLYFGALGSLIMAMAKDVKTNFFSDKDGLIKRRSDAINDVIKNKFHRMPIIQNILSEETNTNENESIVQFNSNKKRSESKEKTEEKKIKKDIKEKKDTNEKRPAGDITQPKMPKANKINDVGQKQNLQNTTEDLEEKNEQLFAEASDQLKQEDGGPSTEEQNTTQQQAINTNLSNSTFNTINHESSIPFVATN